MNKEILEEMPEWLRTMYTTEEWKNYEWNVKTDEVKMAIYTPDNYVKWRNRYNDPTKWGHRLRKFCDVYDGQGESITGLFHADTGKGYIIRTCVPAYAHHFMEIILRDVSDNKYEDRAVDSRSILDMTKKQILDAEIR